MKDRNNGLILGALLLVFFTVYTLRQDFYLQIVQNYGLVLAKLQGYVPKILLVVIIIIFAKLLISIINPILERYFKLRGKDNCND